MLRGEPLRISTAITRKRPAGLAPHLALLPSAVQEHKLGPRCRRPRRAHCADDHGAVASPASMLLRLAVHQVFQNPM
jgi:hypothetical protein